MGKTTDDGHGYQEPHDLGVPTERELNERVRSYGDMARAAHKQFEWIFGAFVHTLKNDMHFSRKRVREVLDGVRRRFARYGSYSELAAFASDDGHLAHFDNVLEDVYRYQYFFHGGRVFLRDLEAPPEEYFDDLATDIRRLARKIEDGETHSLTDEERETLAIMREAVPTWGMTEKGRDNDG